MIISIIAAMGRNREIGKDNDLMWHLPDDMKFFKETTFSHHVIMGRKNYESIPPKYRPFRDRVNVVISRDPNYPAPGCEVCTSLEEALEIARGSFENEAFIIGGAQIYELALSSGLVDRIYLTRIDSVFPEADTFFPEFEPGQWDERILDHHPADDRHPFSFSFCLFERKNH